MQKIPTPTQRQTKNGHDLQPGDGVMLSARLSWKDRRGIARFASVVARGISDTSVFVECDRPVSIPLYRLVQFQLERDARGVHPLPSSLRQGRVLSAVYRIDAPEPGRPQGLALRLLADTKPAGTTSPQPADTTA